MVTEQEQRRAHWESESRALSQLRLTTISTLVGLVVAIGTGFIWVGRQSERLDRLEDALEAQSALVIDLSRGRVQTDQFAARLDEKLAAMRAALDRIERLLEGRDVPR